MVQQAPMTGTGSVERPARDFDVMLVLSGGNTLGAFQAGVYEGCCQSNHTWREIGELLPRLLARLQANEGDLETNSRAFAALTALG
jgi:hypothetical protein